MNRRTLIFLVFAIAVLSTIVISNRESSEGYEASVVLPGLEDDLNDVTKLTIRTAGNRTVTTLVRGDERWVVAERGNYPADIGKIRQNLIALANATVVEQKTADPALYSRLGVEDIANEDATGTELVIESSDESYRIIIGRTGVRGDQAYARKPDAIESLLIAAGLDLGEQPTDWLEKALLDIPSSDVSLVTTTHPDGETVRIKNTGTDGFKPVDLPADAGITETGVADSAGSVLAGLRLVDVSTRANAGLKNIEPIITRFETRNGLNVFARVYTEGDDHFVGFEFSASGQAEDDPANEETATQATTRAAELQSRLGEWLFVLADYKIDQLTYRRSDLFEISE